MHPTSHGSNPNDTNTKFENDESIGGQNTDIMDCDERRENLDLMVNIMEERETEEQETLKQDVMTLGNAFIEDVQDRTQHLDMQYLTGLKRFFTVYLDTVTNTEPAISATPKLASLLHTYFSPQLSTQIHVAGTRRMNVQPTAISRRRDGATKGSKMAPSGRPPKRPLSEMDPNIQIKRGRPDYVKRKQNLRLNELQNQANQHKHGRGH